LPAAWTYYVSKYISACVFCLVKTRNDYNYCFFEWSSNFICGDSTVKLTIMAPIRYSMYFAGNACPNWYETENRVPSK